MKFNPTLFGSLDQAGLRALKAACIEVIKEVHRSGLRWSIIAEAIDVSPDSLAMFISRSSGSRANHSHLRRSQTLEALTSYILENRAAFSPSARAIFELRKESFFRICDSLETSSLFGGNTDTPHSNLNIDPDYENLVDLGYEAIRNMLHIDSHTYENSCKRICGRYLAYRNSILRDKFSVIFIEIRRRNQGAQWEFLSIHYDTLGDKRTSDGMVLPMADNIFLIGDIEHGQGIDFIALRKPFQKDFNKITGFINSVDNDHRLFFSRTMLVKLGIDSEFDMPFEDIINDSAGKLALCVRDERNIRDLDQNGDIALDFLKKSRYKGVVRADARIDEDFESYSEIHNE